MDVFTVSFFGHRQLSDALTIEQRLETHIRQLLLKKDYVEFLVGRDGEFDLLVASVIRRCVAGYAIHPKTEYSFSEIKQPENVTFCNKQQHCGNIIRSFYK